MFSRLLTILALTISLGMGTQLISIETADALPGSTLSKSRKSGTRTHKGRSSSARSKKSTSSKSKKGTRRVTRRTTTRRPTSTTTRTTTRRSPSSSTRTRTTRTTTRRSTPTRTTRTRTTTHRSRPSTRTYRRTHSHSHSSHSRSYRTSSHSHHTHHHTTHHHSSARATTTARRSSSRAPVEAYVTGGLGFSGFASDAIVDGALPGLGYNVAVGAKGKLFGGEIGLNGGGYTLTPGNAPTDIGVVGIAADLKLQPSIAFFEPYVAVGVGGYALNDAVIKERSAGAGLRLGAGADFRFDDVALRVGYQWGGYAFDNAYDAYGEGGFTAATESINASLIVYF